MDEFGKSRPKGRGIKPTDGIKSMKDKPSLLINYHISAPLRLCVRIFLEIALKNTVVLSENLPE
jgi:hypothetical protein